MQYLVEQPTSKAKLEVNNFFEVTGKKNQCSYNPHVQIRQAEMMDVDEVVELDHEVWPEECWATEEMIKSRFETFLEGSFVAVDGKGKMRGVISTLIVDYDLENPIPTWWEVSGNGKIINHNPKGNGIYGIALSVSPHSPRGTALLLVEAAKLLVIKKGLKYGLLGSRIPKFHKYSKNVSVENYVYGKSDHGRPLDPEVGFYEKAGFTIKKILPEYFEDPESLNFGVLMVWENLFYGRDSQKRWTFLLHIGMSN